MFESLCLYTNICYAFKTCTLECTGCGYEIKKLASKSDLLMASLYLHVISLEVMSIGTSETTSHLIRDFRSSKNPLELFCKSDLSNCTVFSLLLT